MSPLNRQLNHHQRQLAAWNRIVPIEFTDASGRVVDTMFKPAIEAAAFVSRYNRSPVDSGLMARIQPPQAPSPDNERFDLVTLKEGRFHRLVDRFLTRREAFGRVRIFNAGAKGTPFRAKAVKIENLPPFVWNEGD